MHEKTIGGENPVFIYRFLDDDILITLGQVGCPACAGNLDLFNAMGITRVMFCGGGGVLDKNIEVGQILVVDGAIRDEGFSYHYIEPSKYIFTNPETTEKITTYLVSAEQLKILINTEFSSIFCYNNCMEQRYNR
ncbi:MAG: nucleoside phosphorylase, partial [Lachnospiraceae bacterium]|nr:nucleoside phosphorylase [Lachnospiraceae bacterium]